MLNIIFKTVICSILITVINYLCISQLRKRKEKVSLIKEHIILFVLSLFIITFMFTFLSTLKMDIGAQTGGGSADVEMNDNFDKGEAPF